MGEWVLMVGFDNKKLNAVKQVYRGCDFLFYSPPTMPGAVETLAADNKYFLVAVFLHHIEDISHIQTIRRLTTAPIIAVQDKYIGAEKVAIIEAGADEYIQWPETVGEFTASCYALIRRYTVLNKQHIPENMVLRGGIVIHEDYRKVFIRGTELPFVGREFDVFSALAAYPERVFTYGQLFEMIWNEDSVVVENSLHSCVRRIRRKLETVPDCPCRIENVHGVGYCFRYNK
ncbi:MAG: response regulator transcription factor [Muribaculaceae bacterium]|nr:response regulator transcription factor [Muribaculaceae bacterium]